MPDKIDIVPFLKENTLFRLGKLCDLHHIKVVTFCFSTQCRTMPLLSPGSSTIETFHSAPRASLITKTCEKSASYNL